MVERDYDVNESADVNEHVDLNEDKTTTRKNDVKVVSKSLRSLSFCEKMRRLLPHRCPLNNCMRDKMSLFIGLFRPGTPPSKRDNETSRQSANRK